MYGTSTGGIIAMLLGALRFDVQECYDIYRTLSNQIFHQKIQPQSSAHVAKELLKDEWYNSGSLEDLIQQKVVEKVGDKDIKLSHPQVSARDGTDAVPRVCCLNAHIRATM